MCGLYEGISSRLLIFGLSLSLSLSPMPFVEHSARGARPGLPFTFCRSSCTAEELFSSVSSTGARRVSWLAYAFAFGRNPRGPDRVRLEKCEPSNRARTYRVSQGLA